MIFDFFFQKAAEEKSPQESFKQIYEKQRPAPIDQEVEWDKTQTIISRTDKFGTIDFANDTFCDVCGYSREELLGQPHNIIRHPDMPQIIFKVLWDNILEGNNFHAIVKNLSKSGKYYWVITNFSITRDYQTGEIISFLARRSSVPKSVVDEYIAPFYKKLLEIEKAQGIRASAAFVGEYLKNAGKTYPEFIYDIMKGSGANYDFLSEFTLGKNPFLVEKEKLDLP